MSDHQRSVTENEVYKTGYDDGCDDGYNQGVGDVARYAAKKERILLDLIAELRDEHANGDGYCGAALEAADRAEQRLAALVRHSDTTATQHGQ